MRTVGILGGMGPEATVDLMRRVIAGTQATEDAGHVPLLVDQNPGVPSRIAHLIDGTGINPAPVLIGMAQRLEAAGAQALAMPCNTAHHYAPQIAAAVGIPFLNMVDLSVAAAAETGQTRIGILGSPALQIAGIYGAAMAARGLEAVYPADQDAMLRAIRQIKLEGANDLSKALLKTASDSIDTTVQILACTEFSLIAGALPPRVSGIDTLDVLARAVIRFAKG
jgi:aspartate racemase